MNDIVERLRDKWQHSEEGCYEAAGEIERLRAQVAALEGALSSNMAIIKKSQEILRDQLIGSFRGLSDHRALNALHGVFDGPAQRAALEKAMAALATGVKDD